MTESETSRLPSWAEQLEGLRDVSDNLIGTWRPEGADEAETQDMNKLALSILANGYLCRVYTDSRRPVFMPLWNYAFNQGGPDPDYVYSTTEVDPLGTYELAGYRGTTRFVEITQQAVDMFTPELLDARGPVPRILDLDDLDLDDDGSFRVLVSATRPSGHDGDWWEMDPSTRRLLVRKCSCDWIGEVDARISINRLDDDGEDMSADEFARRFSDLSTWVEGMIQFDMKLVRYYREHHGINTLLRSTKVDSMGGLPKQVYYDGIHEIDDTEALIIETQLPQRCRYWQALVADDRFCTVDWVNRQSSLNDAQAHIDQDGKFRAVISRRDPGVPNWLDKAHYPWGVIQMRWNDASDYPDPMISKVALADVRAHLPADTPLVTPDQRAQQLRDRRAGAQLRRIW